MADKSMLLILDGLQRAAAEPAGVPLLGGRQRGLFADNAGGKNAAQLCKDQGFIRVLRSESKGKSLHEICTLTEKGLAHLLAQFSPKKVLEGLVQAIEARQAQMGDLLECARQT